MKKLLACILLLAPLTGWADTVTSRLSLTQPDINSANWGTKLNNNFGLIDVGVGVLGKTNSWTGTNNFTGPISISSYTTITSSVAFSTITVVNLTATNATISSATIANASVTGFLVNVSTIVASSATLTGVTGSTLTYSSATLTNANVTGILTAGTANVGTANVSGNESLTGTLTVTSSSTLKGNVGINGNVNQPLTVTSSATLTNNVAINGVLTATGSVTLGSAGVQVTISSNAVVGNTTFYPDAPVAASSITLSGQMTFAGGSTQTVSGQFGRLVQVRCSTTTASTTSSGTTYTLTTSSVTINMKNAADMVKVTAMGIFGNSTVSTAGSFASLFKNAVDTSIGGTGYCGINGTATGVIRSPCTMFYFDYPGTTAGTAYAVYIKSNPAGNATWNNDTMNSFICIEEYTPPNNQ